MARGSVNETPVLNSIRGLAGIIKAFEVGMIQRSAEPWIAASPDFAAVIDLSQMDVNIQQQFAELGVRYLLVGGEIKTGVADSGVLAATRHMSNSMKVCSLGDEVFSSLVDRTHRAQLCHRVISKHAKFVSWAYTSNAKVPSFSDTDTRSVLQSNLPVWQAVEERVKTKGPFPHRVRLFKHAHQTLYSKGRGGVDGRSEYSAILKSPTAKLAWEPNVVTKGFKLQHAAAFVCSRIINNTQYLKSVNAFHDIDTFRQHLNEYEPFNEYTFNLCLDLLEYSSTLMLQGGPSNTASTSVVPLPSDELNRCQDEANKRERQIAELMDVEPYRRMRLDSTLTHRPEHIKKKRRCCVCNDGGDDKGSGGRVLTKCETCRVPVCYEDCAKVLHSAYSLVDYRAKLFSTRGSDTDKSSWWTPIITTRVSIMYSFMPTITITHYSIALLPAVLILKS
mmetsp:Transcript_34556/g.75650  ORF Transcript_34556/g.75650 Transcript_34556/m.75650 type:complete len:448 (+) Transcript_34556:2073-3416(+)